MAEDGCTLQSTSLSRMRYRQSVEKQDPACEKDAVCSAATLRDAMAKEGEQGDKSLPTYSVVRAARVVQNC